MRDEIYSRFIQKLSGWWGEKEFIGWLRGEGDHFPLVSLDDSPYMHIMAAAGKNKEVLRRLGAATAKLLNKKPDMNLKLLGSGGERVLTGLLYLAAMLEQPETLHSPVKAVLFRALANKSKSAIIGRPPLMGALMEAVAFTIPRRQRRPKKMKP